MPKSFIFALHVVAATVVIQAALYHGANGYISLALLVGFLMSVFRKCV
nr:MAG TPA_asm: hypothetical protein [Caudoviricetes sp.]